MKRKEEWEKEIVWDTKGKLCEITKDDEVGIRLKIDYWGAWLTISGKYFPMGITIKIPDESLVKLKTLLEQLKVKVDE